MEILSRIFHSQLVIVSNFGSFYWIPIFTAAFITLFLIYKGYTRRGVLFFLTLAASLVAQLIKGIFRTARPSTNGLHLFLPEDIYGFPSGHTLMYTAFFGFLIYLNIKIKTFPKWLRVIAIFISVYFISFIGISRVMLGYHYIKDVLGGYFFGAIYLAILIYLDNRQNSLPKNKD